jgi:CHAT domain-containing protein
MRWLPLGPVGDVLDELAFTRFEVARAMLPARHRNVRGTALDATLDRLDELVGARLAAAAGDRELVIAPIAPLHTLPWGSLPSLRHRPVTVSPSATTWLQATTRPRQTSARVVVVAGPNLAHAEWEATRISEIAGAATTLLGPAADSVSVIRALDGAAVVHLACHGRHHPDSPLFSSLLLVDGPLTVYELEGLRAAPELVILSACDSAVAAASVGDELMGLTATLLALGSRTLIGATSPVSDASSVPLMIAFHEALAIGHTPAAALAAARHAVDQSDPTARATAVAFGCFGAGR